MRITLSKAFALAAVAGLAAILQFGTSTPADARRAVRAHSVRHVNVRQVNVRHNNYYRNRRIARGVAVGVGTAVVVGTAARVNTCSNLAYRCNRGEVWACIDHDSRCY